MVAQLLAVLSNPPRRRKTWSRTMGQRHEATKRGQQVAEESSQIRRTVISASLTSEVSKLKDELTKLLIINII